MIFRNAGYGVLLVLAGGAVSAQTELVVDCADPANAEAAACLELPDPGVTNFVPLVAPVAGLLAVGAIAAAGAGGSTPATSTSSTGGN